MVKEGHLSCPVALLSSLNNYATPLEGQSSSSILGASCSWRASVNWQTSSAEPPSAACTLGGSVIHWFLPLLDTHTLTQTYTHTHTYTHRHTHTHLLWVLHILLLLRVPNGSVQLLPLLLCLLKVRGVWRRTRYQLTVHTMYFGTGNILDNTCTLCRFLPKRTYLRSGQKLIFMILITWRQK